MPIYFRPDDLPVKQVPLKSSLRGASSSSQGVAKESLQEEIVQDNGRDLAQGVKVVPEPMQVEDDLGDIGRDLAQGVKVAKEHRQVEEDDQDDENGGEGETGEEVKESANKTDMEAEKAKREDGGPRKRRMPFFQPTAHKVRKGAQEL